MGALSGGDSNAAPRPLDLALALAVLLVAVLAPATFFARLEVAREVVASEEWRALAVGRQIVASGADEAALARTIRAVGREGAPGLSAAFVQTAGGTDEFGIAAPSRMLALGPAGMPVELPRELSGRVIEAAGQARSSRDAGGSGTACVDGGIEAPLLCAVATPGGAVAGVLAGRSDLQAPFGWPAMATVAGAVLLFLAAWRKPSWRPGIPAAISAAMTAGAGAALLVLGGQSLIEASTAADASLATILGPTAPPLPVHAPALGWTYVAAVALSAAVLAAAGVRALGRVVSDFRERPFLYAAIAPAMIGMVLLIFVPFLMGVYLAFLDNSRNFVGLANFSEILFPSGTSDTNFYLTLGVTVLWTALNVVLHVGIGLGLALILSDARLRGKAIYRVLLIVPWAIPNYITALVWKWIFNTQYGPANAFLALLGVAPVDWLGRSFVTNFAANLTTNTWLGFPFMMVISLGALQSIPADLYEAAEMDGAGRWARFRHVTLPLLKPALFPAIILGTIWTFNMFNVVYLVSGGAPDNQTNILITEAYRAFRVLKNYGLAAAYSLIIFFILVAYTVVTNRVTKAAESVYE